MRSCVPATRVVKTEAAAAKQESANALIALAHAIVVRKRLRGPNWSPLRPKKHAPVAVLAAKNRETLLQAGIESIGPPGLVGIRQPLETKVIKVPCDGLRSPSSLQRTRLSVGPFFQRICLGVHHQLRLDM